MSGKDKYLGSTKYDGKIRRITLIKDVADMLKMRDGDEIEYYYNGEDVIIRKTKRADINFVGLRESLSDDQLRKVMESFCSTNDIDHGKGVNWSKLSGDELVIEFINTTVEMGRNQRISLANAMILELANKK